MLEEAAKDEGSPSVNAPAELVAALNRKLELKSIYS